MDVTNVLAEMPFRVQNHRGNVVLEYTGVDSRGTVLSYQKMVGPAEPLPGTYQDPLGYAIVRLLALLERVTRERDELNEMIQAEPCDRPRRKKQAENGKG